MHCVCQVHFAEVGLGLASAQRCKKNNELVDPVCAFSPMCANSWPKFLRGFQALCANFSQFYAN